MCDFLSICVRRDGAITHIPGNVQQGATFTAPILKKKGGLK